MMKLLFVGDVFAEGGRTILKHFVPELRRELGLDCVVVNAENAAGGRGVTSKIVQEFLDLGVDLLTSGNHIWFQHETEGFISSEPRLLRPANFPDSAPGKGTGIVKVHSGLSVGVINLIGRLFMDSTHSCPFQAADRAIQELKNKVDVIFVDMHAEATSEKRAMGWYLDGRVAGLVGTHTHVQTADDEILPKGTAYLSDAGMTGPHDSVIGMDKGVVLKRFLTGVHQKYTVAEGDLRLNGVVLTIDEGTGRAMGIERLTRRL